MRCSGSNMEEHLGVATHGWQARADGHTLRIAVPGATTRAPADMLALQVNVPKTRRTYCKGKDCKKHTQHKVTQYKAGKVRHIRK